MKETYQKGITQLPNGKDRSTEMHPGWCDSRDASRKTTAFTLIELLVVIAVIAVLMSILVPALSKARQQARDVLCRTNLHSWSQTTILYLADNRDSFWSGNYPGNPDLARWWMDRLRKYYSDIDKVRCCPTAAKTNAQGGARPFMAWGPVHWSDAVDGNYGSYGINGWLQNRPHVTGDAATLYWRKRAAVTFAEEVPMFTDMQWVDAWPYERELPLANESQEQIPGNSFSRVIQNRHGGKQNVVFVDGGCRPVPLKGLYHLRWHTTWDLANCEPPEWPDWMNNL